MRDIQEALDAIKVRAELAEPFTLRADPAYPPYSHACILASQADVAHLLAALEKILVMDTAKVGPDMDEHDVDQCEGYNDALTNVRFLIADVLKADSHRT